MSRRRVLAAVAALAAAGSAAAYVRTTDATTGKAIAWRVPVVTFHVNPDFANAAPSCRATGASEPAVDALRASFAQWEQPCAELRLLYGGAVADTRTGMAGSGENLVLLRKGWCSQNAAATEDPCFGSADLDCAAKFDCFDDGCPAGAASCGGWGVIALTSVLYDPGTGRILDADIEVNGWDRKGGALGTSPPQHGWYFTCVDPSPPGDPPPTCANYGDGGCVFMDLRNTVTHEAGHFIGLRHPCGEGGLPSCTSATPPGEVPYAERTMYPTSPIGDFAKRTLSADDVTGVCAIYPSRDGGCGCGSAGGGGTVALAVLALALRRRRGAA